MVMVALIMCRVFFYMLYFFQSFSFLLGSREMRLTTIALGYFKKYVEREIAKASGYSIYKPIQGWRHVRKRKWIYDENRPWTDAAKEANLPGKRLNVLVEPIPESEWKVFKGDRVSQTRACSVYSIFLSIWTCLLHVFSSSLFVLKL